MNTLTIHNAHVAMLSLAENPDERPSASQYNQNVNSLFKSLADEISSTLCCKQGANIVSQLYSHRPKNKSIRSTRLINKVSDYLKSRKVKSDVRERIEGYLYICRKYILMTQTMVKADTKLKTEDQGSSYIVISMPNHETSHYQFTTFLQESVQRFYFTHLAS